MIKKASIRRIVVASFALLIVLVSLYIFPQKEIKIPSKIIYKKAETNAIYLEDQNKLISRTFINVDSTDKEQLANELIMALINNSNKSKYLPLGFSSTILGDVKIKEIKIENDVITVNFDGNIFKDNENNEEKIIESIVYTLTEIEGIKKIKILINDEVLKRLPSSNKIIPEYLDRSIGINRISKFNSLKNTQDVTAYFIGKNNGDYYFVPVTFTTDSEKEKIEIIIKELSGKDFIDDNLSTYISAGVILKNYEILENEIKLEFNNEIFNGFNEIDEEVMYGIALSIYDNYNISTVRFEVDQREIMAYALKSSWLYLKVII